MRVGPVIDFHDVFHRELGVPLGGRKSFMAKHFLDGSQVRTLLQHVGAEGVAQGVRVDVGRKSFRNSNLLHYPADAAGGQARATQIHQ